MSAVQLFATKIWRITTANALAITGGLSLLNFAEDHVYTNAILLTVISLVVFYYASYRDFGELVLPSPDAPVKPWSWHVFLRRMWKITLGNVLWIFAGLTYIFFVVGVSMIYLTTLTLIGFVMMYIDAYRVMEEEEEAAAEDETSAEDAADDTTDEPEPTEETDEPESTEESESVSFFNENNLGTVGE
jgi:predicted RND superfamily exporter protein